MSNGSTLTSRDVMKQKMVIIRRGKRGKKPAIRGKKFDPIPERWWRPGKGEVHKSVLKGNTFERAWLDEHGKSAS
jgi:hypothetical protein